MKLLLTSNGLSNRSIADALFELVGKPRNETKIAFIPTAMNVMEGDKDWVLDDLNNIRAQDIALLDIVDVSALPKEIWLPRLKAADVLFFSGGNSWHLMRWIRESGLDLELPELLKTRVWAGISAGSMVTNPTLALSSYDQDIYYEEHTGDAHERALVYTDFYVRPHYNSAEFPKASKEYLQKIASGIPNVIYALDDQSALTVVDGVVEHVTEGEIATFNQ